MLDRTFRWRDQAVRWARRGTGPDVVFCHGTPWSATVWEPIADALSSLFTVHLWGVPGYGTSEMADGQDVSLGAQGELLVALAPWGSEFFRLVAANTAVFAALPAPLHEALVRAYVAGAAHRALSPAESDMLVAPWLGTVGQPAFYRQIAQADERYTDEVAPRYPEIAVPTSVVWGTEDVWIPVDRAHRLVELIPGAELTLVERAGHLVQLDASEALTSTRQRWLVEHS